VAAVESSASAAFIGKWLAREPEMAIAEVFVPVERRPLFRAWGALLHELRAAMFELSDARVTEVKTAWWAEELIGLAQRRYRHPLTEALADCDAPWSALGRCLLELPDADRRHGDTSEAIDSLMSPARSINAVESALFATGPDEQAARALAIHWLWQRLPRGLNGEDQARIPMHLFARHGLTASQLAAGQGEPLLRDWARELASALPAQLVSASAFRRSQACFDRARMRRLASGKGFTEPPALATLWRAWRAAQAP